MFFSGNRSLSFTKDGFLYAITLKGDKAPWDLNKLYITNHLGKRISLGAVAKIVADAGPNELYHYNQMRSAVLTVDLQKGDGFDEAMPKLLAAVSKE